MTPEPFWTTPIPAPTVEPASWTAPTTPAQLRAYREASMLSLDEVAKAAGVRKDAVWEAETVRNTRLSPAAYVAAVQRARRQVHDALCSQIREMQEAIGDNHLRMRVMREQERRES